MKGNWVRLIVVLLILALFPFLSWYYLQRGIDYRLAALEELEEIGEFDWVNTYDIRDRYIGEAAFQNRYVIAGISPDEPADIELLKSRWTGLIEQFGSRDDVVYVSVVDEDATDLNMAKKLLSEVFMESNHRNHYVVILAQREIESLQSKWLSGIEDDKLESPDKFLVLFNDQGKAVGKYNYMEEARVARLVEHLSIILPQTQDRRDYSDVIRERL
ncbi:MAG: hypothetical protein EA411_10480 [Saprospirales bacterium]|nr:MAG: hypothetical protein EA411_10480 [Saprospirales bacterium]